MRTLLFLLAPVLALSACPRSPAQVDAAAPVVPKPAGPPEVTPPRTDAAPERPPTPIPAADVKPPIISRSLVIQTARTEAADGRGVWMTVGAPVPATDHYADDVPPGATPGEHRLSFVEESNGDYPHLVFEDDQHRRYDFGAAKNQLEGSGFDIEDKSGLAGKSFLVRWDFRPTAFDCCQGDATTWMGMKPTILAIRAQAELP